MHYIRYDLLYGYVLARLQYWYEQVQQDEDWSTGRLTEYNFNMLSERYQTEQRELDDKIRKLTEEMDADVQTTQDAEKWIALIKQCSNPTKLTAELLNTVIEKIVVHEAVKGTDGSRKQKVDIYYRFIGKID